MGQSPVRRSVTDVFGTRRHLRGGVINDAARAAFTYGHCADLAVALHRRTGWPLMVLLAPGDGWTCLTREHADDADRGAPVPFAAMAALWAHVLVRRPDGRLVDIHGARSADTVIAAYENVTDGRATVYQAMGRHRLVPADLDEVYRLESRAPAAPGIGDLFVDAVLALPDAPELPWPWTLSLPEHLAEMIANAREDADEDCPFTAIAHDRLWDLHEEFQLLRDAVARGLLPAELAPVAQTVLGGDVAPAVA